MYRPREEGAHSTRSGFLSEHGGRADGKDGEEGQGKRVMRTWSTALGLFSRRATREVLGKHETAVIVD